MLYSGVTGKISITKTPGTPKDIAHMSEWSLDLNKEMIEVVSFGDDYKEKVPSTKDWSASCDGAVDFATDSGQKDLVDAFDDGTMVEANFYLDTGTFFKGNAYVESLSFGHAADGSATISISLAGSGGVMLTVPVA